MTRLSDDLILCTRNRPDEVRACLATVRSQTHVPHRVLVVDSSDDDATKQVVAEATAGWPSGTVEHLRASRGVTHQRNVGIDASAADVVHFVDDDTLLDPGYFAAILDVFDGDPACEIGGVGGFVTNQPPHRFRRVDEWLGLDSRTEGVVLRSGRNVRVHDEPAGDLDVDWLSGCSMSFRRSVLELERPSEAPGPSRMGEDVELGYRIRQRWRLVVTPRARIEHLESNAGRASREAFDTIEIISRYDRVCSGVGHLDRRAFWISVWGQLFWYGAKGLVTLSGTRLRTARSTARAIREIRASRRSGGRARGRPLGRFRGTATGGG